jgi:hypothetical protein
MSKKQMMIPFQGERNLNLGMLEWISCKPMLVVGGQCCHFNFHSCDPNNFYMFLHRVFTSKMQ